ncbi:Pre-mRNA-splicing factor 18 [Aspergillus nanangensis]|uniref:Pre-mRNA-splicing factor 18 n=1 Tax=Aspergillus nanangensis TaxID=2582783 RepID=A0AAD4GRF4_ASPNN|nr:Pre-mRNA-splicing factor 18 [Aspergillus nanangensis]
MDFAALMSKEIAKTKPPSKKDDTTPEPSKKKYVRRGDLETERITAYNEEQARLQREREERMTEKRKFEDEEATRRQERDDKKRRLAEESRKKREDDEAAQERDRRKRLGLPELPPAGENDDAEADAGGEDIADEELVEKLRQLEEPVRLFGESHRGRLRRYRRIVQRSLTPQVKMTDGPIPTTLEPVEEKDMKISTTLPKDTEGRKYLFRQLASYFNMVLAEWESALVRRDVSVKQSLQGRQAYNAMVQSRENMKPLFRKFEKVDVDNRVLEHVVEIVHNAQLRRYVDANDAYLRLSIGKAAWPIGVTMVGIHERSAREKLHQSDQQAHILSDEMTRKYLQSIKRCLSFAQTRWPPDDQLQIMG